ncbi:MAG: hypothetical protein HY329_26010 [Chloroflexi bacterium]|nr:hypothetical protein [Chloroflexota bacterium]
MSDEAIVRRADLLALLERLHHGPAQHAAAARVALAVWERADRDGDPAGAASARELLHRSIADLMESLAEFERAGRQLAAE